MLTDAFWNQRVRGEKNPTEYYRAIKQQITIRLDKDVIAWFEAHAGGRGYQTEINRVLRDHVVRTAGRSGRRGASSSSATA